MTSEVILEYHLPTPRGTNRNACSISPPSPSTFAAHFERRNASCLSKRLGTSCSADVGVGNSSTVLIDFGDADRSGCCLIGGGRGGGGGGGGGVFGVVVLGIVFVVRVGFVEGLNTVTAVGSNDW